MRIRKRQVPLPLSSLSPVPVISDRQFNGSPPIVQLHPRRNPVQEHHRKSYSYSQPSGHPNQPIGITTHGSNGLDDADGSVAQTHKKIDALVSLQDKDYERGKIQEHDRDDSDEDADEDADEEKSGNDSRNKSILDAEIVLNGVVSSHLSCPHQVVGRWCEGEKAFPLKKRRGSFERRANEDTSEVILDDVKDNIHKKMKTKNMKTKMNKRFGLDSHHNEQDNKDTTTTKERSNVVDDDNNNNNTSSYTATSANKKKARGGALMEGSRCSRVNGRGWRCCQQTLVGYSLCEHHLGKGRLRSMTSVRSRSLGNTKNNENTLLLLSSSSNVSSSNSSAAATATSVSSLMEESKKANAANEVLEEEGDAKRPLMTTTKKTMKLGIVKARSISSLLGQTNNEQLTVGDSNR
ncbi:uncharacterized protein LOC123227221 [Mangifera indica]|uniref:uncharacterized protein LOC123227221 n=1 Tax=Mangifera indica TaxID=29780 RepID=UPI001CFB6B0B|nr:uncharacterized protein LOC123227221 [Mangifera indica]